MARRAPVRCDKSRAAVSSRRPRRLLDSDPVLKIATSSDEGRLRLPRFEFLDSVDYISVARDTVNLPAVAATFDDLVSYEHVGVGVPPLNGRPRRPLKCSETDNAMFLCHSLRLFWTGYVKCSHPQFDSGDCGFNGRSHPTAKDNVFVEIETQVAVAIRDGKTQINHYRQHRKMGWAKPMSVCAFKRVVVSHPDERIRRPNSLA
jgi:hypothetical protein